MPVMFYLMVPGVVGVGIVLGSCACAAVPDLTWIMLLSNVRLVSSGRLVLIVIVPVI